MASPELQQYLDLLKTESSAGLYVSRRFSAATNEGGAEPDLGIQFRGVLRDREPALAELLKHPRVVILGEPGAGKSVVARAAVRTLIEEAERVPVYSELKQYRADSNLVDLLKASVPAWLLDVDVRSRASDSPELMCWMAWMNSYGGAGRVRETPRRVAHE